MMKPRGALAILAPLAVLCGLVPAGCASAPSKAPVVASSGLNITARGKPQPVRPADGIPTVCTGTLVWLSFEGGFWGIQTAGDDFDLRFDRRWKTWIEAHRDQRVSASGFVHAHSGSTHMWGHVMSVDSLWTTP